jgi:phosphoenolpyruvate synthase/pyruvate phosphate dikinase
LTSIRDSEELAKLFDEQDEAVKWTIESVIREARKASAKVDGCWPRRRRRRLLC